MYNYSNLKNFVRYGRFHITKQKGYSRSDSFHSPPVNKGFYCMPKILQSLFLVGSIDESQKGKKPNGYFKKDSSIYDYVKTLQKVSHSFTIERDMMVWHHLGEYTKSGEIKERSKYWVKTTFLAYTKAVNKQFLECKRGCRDIFEVFIEEKIN